MPNEEATKKTADMGMRHLQEMVERMGVLGETVGEWSDEEQREVLGYVTTMTLTFLDGLKASIGEDDGDEGGDDAKSD